MLKKMAMVTDRDPVRKMDMFKDDSVDKPSLSLKDFTPQERAQILAIALKKGWAKEEINEFLTKVDRVYKGYKGKYSIIDILERTKSLSDISDDPIV